MYDIVLHRQPIVVSAL